MRDKLMKWGNYVVALAEAPVAAVQQAAAGFGDGLHNLGHALAYDNQQNTIAKYDTPTGEKQPGAADAVGSNLWARTRDRLNNRFGESRLSYGLIAIPAVGAIALAGANTVRRVMGEGGHDGFGWMDAAHVGATGSAFLLAGGMLASAVGMQQKVKRTRREHSPLAGHVEDYRDHAGSDALISGLATAEAVVHSTAGTTASVIFNGAVAALASWQAYRFWPSWKNIQKRLPKHDHGHGNERAHAHEHAHHHEHGASCDHAHFIPPEALQKASAVIRRTKAVGRAAISQVVEAVARKGRDWQQARLEKRELEHLARTEGPWWRWLKQVQETPGPLQGWAGERLAADKEGYERWEAARRETMRRPGRLRKVAAAGAAALALSFGVSSEAGNDQVEAQPAPPPVEQVEPSLQPAPPVKPSTPEVFAGTCTPVEQGDSQWNAVQQQLEGVTGERPSVALINAATLFTAQNNLGKHPEPDSVSPKDCLTLPSDWALGAMAEASSQSTLGQTLSKVNQFADWDQAMGATPIFDQLKKELMKVAG